MTLPSVFLSYARADDEALTRRLRDRLEDAGVSVWFDRDSLPSRGLTFVQEIRDAIHGRDRVVLVLGLAALSSQYVEAEWRYALEAAKVVIPVVTDLPAGKGIEDALPRELSRLQIVDARDRREAWVVEELLRHLGMPEPRLGPLLHVPPPPPHYQPRRLAARRVESALQLDQAQRLTADVRERTMVLHGMGGVGKSVAAAAVARHIQVRRQFGSGVVWVDLGREPDVLAGLRRIGAAMADDLHDYSRVEDIVPRLAQRIVKAPLLIVADNVWNEDDLAPFLALMGSGTHLLVTARDGGIATRLGAVSIAVDPLTSDEALQLLGDWVGGSVGHLPDSARTVADECGGLPLALAVVGAMARGGTPWEDISASMDQADLGFLAERLPDYPYPNLLRALRASLDALESSEDELERGASTCFQQLAALRWDRPVPESTLVTLWTVRATLTEPYARRVLSILAAKALLRTDGQSPRRLVSLHDLLHDLARATVPDLAAEHGALIDAYAAKDAESPFVEDDGYLLDHFSYHLDAAGRGAQLPSILRRETSDRANAWWSVRLRSGQVSGYVADVRRALADARERGDTVDVIRWALMIASARSAVGGVSSSFAALLLGKGVWTPAQALAAADWASGSGRFEMLVAALPFLPAQQQDSVAEEAALLARREPEDGDRFRRLLDLAQALQDPARRRFVTEALPPGEVPSPNVEASSLLRVWQLDPDRTDAVEAAVAKVEERSRDPRAGWYVAYLAVNAPASQLDRVRRMADRLAEPAARLEVLLALAERGDQPLEDLVRDAEVELSRSADDWRAGRLEARLAPFRSEPSRAASVHAVIVGGDKLKPADRLLSLLSVTPVATGDDRDSAVRAVFGLLAGAGREQAETLVASAAAARLRRTQPLLFQEFVGAALPSVRAIQDAWSRMSGLVLLLPETEASQAQVVLEEEVRLVLRIDDQRERSECLAAFASRLETGAAERAVGPALQLMIDTLPVDELASAAVPLLAHAGAADVAAVQAALARSDRFAWDVRPALFGAWARHGNWEAALDALVGGSPSEVERAVDPVADVMPEWVAEELLGSAIERGDPEFYSAVVRLVPRAAEDSRGPVLNLGFDALEALEKAHDQLRLIERLAPLLSVEALARLDDRVPEGADRMDRDRARLAMVRAWIGHGDRIRAADVLLRIEVADSAAQAALEVAHASPPDERDGWLEAVEDKARALLRSSEVELLCGSALLREGPQRARLLEEAARAAEAPDESDLVLDDRADALRIVAAAQEGHERERLLLAAWDAAPRGGSWKGIQSLTTLAPLLAEAAPSTIRARWERSLETATVSRPAALEELTALADVVVALAGSQAVVDMVSVLDDVDRWWP